MELSERTADPLFSYLDKIMEILDSMKEKYEQGKTRFVVEDYYSVMTALERIKEVKERLAVVRQRQEGGFEAKNPLMATLRIKDHLE
jgi:hypothetical protein